MNNFIVINLSIINCALLYEQNFHEYRFIMDLCSLAGHEIAHGIIRKRFNDFNYHTPIGKLASVDDKPINHTGNYFETEFWQGIKPKWYFPDDQN